MEIIQDAATVMISIAAALGVAWKLLVPHLKGVMEDEVTKIGDELGALREDHDDKLMELEQRSINDYEALTKLSENNRAIMGALLALLRHAEDTNHTGEIGDAQQELQNHIINML
jgi:hypothetical protein